jgi:hypothetical protein
MDSIRPRLKQAKELEAEYCVHAITELQQDLARAKARADRLLTLYIDGEIKPEDYKTKCEELENPPRGRHLGTQQSK